MSFDYRNPPIDHKFLTQAQLVAIRAYCDKKCPGANCDYGAPNSNCTWTLCGPEIEGGLTAYKAAQEKP